jgi:hypothetical protein
MPGIRDGEAAYTASGEVTERAELLNGSLQVALDGEVESREEQPWRCSSSMSWQIGRAGEVPLSEGDLTLEAGSGELFAVLDHGTASVDPDTGAATVRAVFLVDGAQGGALAPGDRVECLLHIEAETWTGELRLGP